MKSFSTRSTRSNGSSSLPVRGAWIEMLWTVLLASVQWSLPVRGAWIEITLSATFCASTKVAPRAGSVD